MQKSHAARKLYGSVFYITGVIADGSFTIAGIEILDHVCYCDLDLDLITFI